MHRPSIIQRVSLLNWKRWSESSAGRNTVRFRTCATACIIVQEKKLSRQFQSVPYGFETPFDTRGGMFWMPRNAGRKIALHRSRLGLTNRPPPSVGSRLSHKKGAIQNPQNSTNTGVYTGWFELLLVCSRVGNSLQLGTLILKSCARVV